MQTDLEGSECGNVKLFHEFRQARMLVGTIVVETVVPGERTSILWGAHLWADTPIAPCPGIHVRQDSSQSLHLHILILGCCIPSCWHTCVNSHSDSHSMTPKLPWSTHTSQAVYHRAFIAWKTQVWILLSAPVCCVTLASWQPLSLIFLICKLAIRMVPASQVAVKTGQNKRWKEFRTVSAQF